MGWWSYFAYSLMVFCLAVNYIAWKNVGQIRLVSLLIVLAWSFQEAHARFSGNHLAIDLYLVSDALICGFLIAFIINQPHWREKVLLASYAPMVVGYFTISDANLHWWFLYCGTMAQALFALPWVVFAKIKGSSDHGPIRELPDGVS